jgi:hypothetical protein
MRKPGTIETPHPNTPPRLWRRYKKFHGNCYKTAESLGVNPARVWQLLKNGVEPTDRSEKGKEARRKLFLPLTKKKSGKAPPIQKVPLPEYLLAWRRLPKQEREKVIQQYMNWRKSHEPNQKKDTT